MSGKLTITSDTGSVTNDSTPSLSGTLTNRGGTVSGVTVTIYKTSGATTTSLGTATTDSDGNWTYDVTSALSNGDVVTAKAAIMLPANGTVTFVEWPTLTDLSLDSLSFPYTVLAGTVLANITGKTAGSSLSLSPDDGRLALAGNDTDGWTLVRGLTAWSAGSFDFSIIETKADANGNPHTTDFTASIVQAALLDLGGLGAMIGNSWFANANMRHYVDWTRSGAEGRLYVPPPLNLGLAGDRYVYLNDNVPGYLNRVPLAMSARPQWVMIGNAVNDIHASYDATTMNGYLQQIIDAIEAHDNYQYLDRIFLTTTPQFWSMTSAQNTARIAHNNFIRTKCANYPDQYSLIDDDAHAGLGFGDFGDEYHVNAVGAYKVGMSSGADAKAAFSTDVPYPSVGVSSTSIHVSGSDLSHTYIRLTATAHGLTTGQPIRITGVSGNLSPSIANTKFIVGQVIDADTFELYGMLASAYTGSVTAATITSGLAGTIGTNWQISNSLGVTATAATETYNGRSWLTLTISGTPSSTASMGLYFTASSKTLPGKSMEGWARIRLTNAAGNGPPVGIMNFNPIMGTAKMLGSNIDTWTIPVNTSGHTPGDTLHINFYNALTQPPNSPPTPMTVDDASYDPTQYRVTRLTITAGTSATDTATAIANAILADTNLAAAGITATSSGTTVTIPNGSGPGFVVTYDTSGTTTISPTSNIYPFNQMVDEHVIRIPAGFQNTAAGSTVLMAFYVYPRGGQSNTDIKLWIADPLAMGCERVAYAPPANATWKSGVQTINIPPSASLSSNVASSTLCQSVGGAVTYTYQWYRNVTATNATGTGDPDSNASGWEEVSGATTNPYTSSDSGHYLICKQTVTNSMGSFYAYSTKTTGTVP